MPLILGFDFGGLGDWRVGMASLPEKAASKVQNKFDNFLPGLDSTGGRPLPKSDFTCSQDAISSI